MRSYTNKQGDRITVSEEHLQTAVRIKKELQKASPSRKASMRQLVQMMEVEGFYDADSNESYRCMLKDYQKSIGELPEAPKYAEMVADSKLESIKEIVGEIAFEKRENQHVLRELNRVKRDVIDFAIVAEQIGKAFQEYDWSKIEFKYQPIAKTDKKMIICLSDLHIGALVDTEFNQFSYKIAQDRMQKYLNKVIDDIKRNEISEVYLIDLGDNIENPYMHNLAFSCEFTATEQVVRASDLIIKFIIGLKEFVTVKFAGIAGNHDRYNEDKVKSLDGDHAVKSINYAIQSFIENSKIDRVEYIQAKDYSHSFSVNGYNVIAIHGDLDNRNDTGLLSKFSSLDNVEYDILLMGHYHTREVRELDENKFVIVSGSLKGADNYSINKFRRKSSSSQTYIILNDDGEIEVKWATLN